MLGYYYGAGPYGNHLSTIRRLADWTHIRIETWPRADQERIAAQIHDLDLQVSYSLIDVLWRPVAQSQYIRRPDWQTQFDYARRFIDLFQPRLHSVYGGDEPLANGIPFTQLAETYDYIRGAGYKIMSVEEQPRTPMVEFFGITHYRSVHTARQVYSGTPEANVLVVPAFTQVGGKITNQWEWWALWEDVVQSRERSLLAFFLYPDYEAHGRSHQGASSSHGILAAHAEMLRRDRES